MRPLLPLLLSLICHCWMVNCEENEDDWSKTENETLLAIMHMHSGSCTANELNENGIRSFLEFGTNFSSRQYINRLNNWSLNCKQESEKFKCQNISELMNNTDGKLNLHEMKQALPELVLQMQMVKCKETSKKSDGSVDATTYLYSLLAVLVMKIAALSGIVTFPCMSAKVYTMALSFLVPLAISSLLGSTLFIFIPDALELQDVPFYNENHGSPILKLSAIGGGIYLFYMIEKLLRLIMEKKEKSYYRNSRLGGGSYELTVAQAVSAAKPTRKVSTTMAGDINTFPKNSVLTKRDSRISLSISTEQQEQLGQIEQANKAMPPIAWIAIMGDCIRNFIDGIAIGAAFTLNILTGLSVSIAFIFEEIPTELGDVAILLNAGMSICRATMFHFGAAFFAFLGAVCGILLGDLGESQVWIFAVSAGSFMYISLVDLMPEMNHALDSDKSKEIGRLKIFLLQNFGLVLGFSVTAVLGYFSENLHIDFGSDNH